MTEKELIAKIQKLQQIEPEKDWILFTKTQILGETTSFFSFSTRLAFASLLILLILAGSFGFAQNSLPGDLLYPLKRMTEKGQQVFVTEEEKPKAQLKLANKRLEELTIIAETNRVKKLAPAIKEFEASISEAAKELNEQGEPDPKIVEQAKNLQEKNENLERTYGVLTNTEELEKTLSVWEQIEEQKEMVRDLIKDLKNSSLTEKQKEILDEVETDFENGDYSEALEKILILSSPQE